MSNKEIKEFQAYTKQLLDLVINSIYTHKEIFLRELLSNASDALDKLRFASLTNPDIVTSNEEFYIEIKLDKDNRTISISDNGIGMTYDEVIQHIGTIAHSGTKSFFENLKLNNNQNINQKMELIGQFGVGFYSSFMVAKKVVILTKSPFSQEGVRWESIGDGTYSIEKYDKAIRGTTIILNLREDDANLEEGEKYSVFLEQWKIEELVKKYSDFIRYPIKMEVNIIEEKDTAEGKKSVEKKEIKTLNVMKPLWTRDKSEIKTEEYEEFYQATFHDWTKPFDVIHTKAEGLIEYVALLYIPSKAPFNLMTAEYERGLKLFSKNIFIMDNCKELIPEHYRFVKGLVDSPDFSLNISREILQHDRQLRIISKNIEKKITESLLLLLKDKRDEYEKWWREFGTVIKSGIYSDFMKERTYLIDLLIFESSNSPDKFTTLEEYISRMKPEQKEIFYISGTDRRLLENHPQVRSIIEKGFEVLYLVDRIDEFMMMNIPSYKEKQLKSLNKIEKDSEKSENLKIKESEIKPLLEIIEKNLAGKVKKVVLSNNLNDSLSCIVTENNGLSIQMEKVLSELEGKDFPKSEKILQLNPEHPIFKKLEASYKVDQNSPKISQFSQLFYDEALLVEGILPENPVTFISTINKLLEK